MSHDEFTRLFKYMEVRFSKLDQSIDKRFDTIDQRFDQVFSLIDQVLKNQEITQEEMLVMGHQLDRHDRWLHQLADKIGYQLSS